MEHGDRMLKTLTSGRIDKWNRENADARLKTWFVLVVGTHFFRRPLIMDFRSPSHSKVPTDRHARLYIDIGSMHLAHR